LSTVGYARDNARTTIYLVRHGQIDANVEGRWFGSTDQALNPLGERQAARLGSKYDALFPLVSAIYSSPLIRTVSTANSLSGDRLPVTAKGGLREYGIGELEGLHFDTLAVKHNFFERNHQDQDHTPPGGESINQVSDRMLTTLKALTQAHAGESIVVVSHGAAMAIALSCLLRGNPYPFDDYHMSNTGVSTLVWDGAWNLLSFNETRHLEPPLPAVGRDE
jgi:probable phosphoglycerate mutase